MTVLHSITHRHTTMTKPGVGEIVICSPRLMPWREATFWFRAHQLDGDWREITRDELADLAQREAS